MSRLDLSSLQSDRTHDVTLGRSRIFAALLALIFPFFGLYFIIGGLITGYHGSSLGTHTLFLILLVPGLGALFYWCRRYTVPAIIALRTRKPVFVRGDKVVILGNIYPIRAQTVLRFNGTIISLHEGRQKIASVPSYFIRIRSMYCTPTGPEERLSAI